MSAVFQCWVCGSRPPFLVFDAFFFVFCVSRFAFFSCLSEWGSPCSIVPRLPDPGVRPSCSNRHGSFSAGVSVTMFELLLAFLRLRLPFPALSTPRLSYFIPFSFRDGFHYPSTSFRPLLPIFVPLAQILTCLVFQALSTQIPQKHDRPSRTGRRSSGTDHWSS